jgi:predicted helicase
MSTISLQNILKKYCEISFSERDKGDRFERLIKAYLQTDPKYANLFTKIWLWNEFPGRKDFGGTDTGIDLVALAYGGDYWAIQCKCYQESTTIDKPAVDSFLSTSSRRFVDEGGQTVGFSYRLWISTTNKWGLNASEAIKNQTPPVTRVNLYDLQQAPVDWEKLDQGISGEPSRINERKMLPHQIEALEKTHEYFKRASRGKLIMACGTGKTFNTLRIAENETNGKGLILFLVPSISLLGQTLKEWTTFSQSPIFSICICSDPKVSKSSSKNDDDDSFSVVDLALPASTDVRGIVRQFERIPKNCGMTVVFSTYQSIEVVAEAQKELRKKKSQWSEFDLIVCDEAHRTTGVALSKEDESSFTKVHDDNFISGKKRLYMTATPRLYSDDVKSKAAQADAILCSMDDPSYYGEEIYRIGFGEAVERDLLTDYKVLILTLSENDVPPAIQKMIASEENEISIDDASKLIGCINALSKQILGDEGIIKDSDPEPMRRAVAFCQNIAVSKKITDMFNTATEAYIDSLPVEDKEHMVSVNSKHIDGTMSAPERDELLSWLKAENDDRECRILTNVRCLSEGVDVPSLDAVLFLSARNSQIDVVQSVGRVMRKAGEKKKYGYIIIPVLVPSNVEADEALNDNERYKVVWTVLNALRAHDDRFNATVNKIELNQRRPDNILIGRPGIAFEDGAPYKVDNNEKSNTDLSKQLAFQFENLQHVLFARMVQKVGDRRYWEQWAKNVAEIAERQAERISRLIKDEGEHQKAFGTFLIGLQKNINPSITQQEAVEMLSQHIVTQPVFEALFEGYSFVKNNPISISLQSMLDLLETQAIEKDTETLQKFYQSVKVRASGIDNAEGKQRVIVELYDKFFRTAFPKMVERLGIVYTPVEIVDFIIHSVNDVLKKEFDRSLGEENIHILDPFTGTGTFITRLLQSGLIAKNDLKRKYKSELHANEIVLLAYYIAAVNIENTYHDVIGELQYTPFEGICLTDTFQLGENENGEKYFSEMFPKNSERVQKQKKAPLRVIIGNPPYSIGQKSANDNAQNQSYPKLDERIAQTYAAASTAGLNKSLYDAYIKAFRWSTDRLSNDGGIICFVTNGAWIDGNSTDGFRKWLEREFTSIYVFNLRGNARTSGELRQREAGNIFGGGSRTPIAITLLVKNPSAKIKNAKIYYHDIGDYLSREEKLEKIRNGHSVNSGAIKWRVLQPNEYGDWLNQRNDMFNDFIPLEPGKKYKVGSQSYFVVHSMGTATNRDNWVYNFSKQGLINNIKTTIDHYQEQLKLFRINKISEPSRNSAKGTWTRDWMKLLKRNVLIEEVASEYRITHYRPFTLANSYFHDDLNQERYQLPSLFPRTGIDNRLICVSSVGSNKGLAVLITKYIPDLHFVGDTQCFPLYYYEERRENPGLFDLGDDGDYVHRDGISDFILDRARKQYSRKVTKEDIFYYVYGFLHSKEYGQSFENDLRKSLPRIPLVDDVQDFWAFSQAGRKLADLHINYESVPPFDGIKVVGAESNFYEVEKMRFPKKNQRDTILFNSKIKIEGIPDRAYDYVVNGKSAIEWIMERYQITNHKESGIKNDPNDWAREVGNPRYILDLLLSIINVSMQTVDIVEELPKLCFSPYGKQKT